MKKLFLLAATLLLAAPIALKADSPLNLNRPLQIRVVNFKTCVEQSKLGKQEQANFENLKNQMESVLEEKEKSFNELSTKINDPDYLDSLSTEAENDLKQKVRALTQELSQNQNFYYQTLQQTNLKVLQKLTDAINSASKKVAKELQIDLVLSEEAFSYFDPNLDISSKVIEYMDQDYQSVRQTHIQIQ